DPQAEIDATPRRDAADDYDGDVSIEAYTVMFGREGEPEVALLGCLTPDGARTWANCNDADTMRAMTVEEFVGRPAKLAMDGTLTVSGDGGRSALRRSRSVDQSSVDQSTSVGPRSSDAAPSGSAAPAALPAAASVLRLTRSTSVAITRRCTSGISWSSVRN